MALGITAAPLAAGCMRLLGQQGAGAGWLGLLGQHVEAINAWTSQAAWGAATTPGPVLLVVVHGPRIVVRSGLMSARKRALGLALTVQASRALLTPSPTPLGSAILTSGNGLARKMPRTSWRVLSPSATLGRQR